MTLPKNTPELRSACCGAGIEPAKPVTYFPWNQANCKKCHCVVTPKPSEGEGQERKNSLLIMLKNAYEDSVTAGSWTSLYAVSKSVIEEATRRGIEQERSRCVGIVEELLEAYAEKSYAPEFFRRHLLSRLQDKN